MQRRAERLDFGRKRPSFEVRFAARELRALAAEYEALAEKATGDDGFLWRRAAAKAAGRANDLDWRCDEYVRIALRESEADKLADLMDDHPDASYGGHWRRGFQAFIDWDSLHLLVHIGEFAGFLHEAIAWSGVGRDVDEDLARVSRKIRRRREAHREGRTSTCSESD